MCSLTPPSPAAWWGRVRLMLPSAPCPEERDLPRGKAGWQCSSAAYGAGKLVKEEQYLLFYYCLPSLSIVCDIYSGHPKLQQFGHFYCCIIPHYMHRLQFLCSTVINI